MFVPHAARPSRCVLPMRQPATPLVRHARRAAARAGQSTQPRRPAPFFEDCLIWEQPGRLVLHPLPTHNPRATLQQHARGGPRRQKNNTQCHSRCECGQGNCHAQVYTTTNTDQYALTHQMSSLHGEPGTPQPSFGSSMASTATPSASSKWWKASLMIACRFWSLNTKRSSTLVKLAVVQWPA